jgi:3-oxoacyl-[acyl-carrier protein] reductase
MSEQRGRVAITGGSRGIGSEIAEVVAFLAGPGRRVNGRAVYANGGSA